ncbi:hypothetical protein A3B42_01305 [Candidatus Daviesbacteria bacterium RIFCSPLOWO2_01_FULL_38_10]|uniref:Toxin YoeB n=1 Tax=Candidatus Daviesbacteria bacterium GW2011_GWF2_38_6 TaxID=1618432 RepID=A0A0G0KIH2_9BACT|nr:MAG: hypothetical protein US99_C0017G0005 [Candidatus Daviesbacteria bacterium GW2011_GWF2_38_6]OGE26136.1 MAG: hypothetical protein A3D02_00530 [Candidatus Daviesbacteria bacterium RIFCSPHIGHO2_02_FULL_39_41]OGE37172.1 MAG: hypothetical protein A3B42_01305 [Candidatus Daviesbacteria bacterium RIFCSPLOWO2_01_FULL_38_10]OGE43797.1 MAG: hypothetical protein A3E67_03470 [Candidatus Daviesbacteria bacterium RIFCSPHIGHO2_12_FULL_38_25]OGE68228.1 MAG: hypothetical protein A3H81_04035 [Candidatus D
MNVKPLKETLRKYLDRRDLTKKFNKQIKLLSENFSYPSLNTEIIEPKEFRLYSFRIDRKYRAIFALTNEGEIEIIDINDHYQ